MTGKIKTINIKIEQNKDQYNLDKKNCWDSALSTEMLANLNFYQVKMFYQKKDDQKKQQQSKGLNIHYQILS